MTELERDARMQDASNALGYTFVDGRLLDEALTHKSYINELRERTGAHNERLEFLGDAVLSLIISEHLTVAFPRSAEGALSKLKAGLVSEPSLAGAARRLELGRRLRLGRGEELTGGRDKPSLLANALEAVIAAIYLDGGLKAAQAFTLKALADELRAVEEKPASQDFKTQCQEWCQKVFESLPQYVTVGESGPDHQKQFEVHVLIRGEVFGVGTGSSKKEAEQMAAREALSRAAGEKAPIGQVSRQG
jgi:ribonuclease-3